MSENSFEILSPAGSLDTLICAVNNGADAVYIGGQCFSARKNAVNFTNDEIVSGIKYAHLHESKVYVTVNTLIGDSEFNELYSFIAFLYEAGADALIIQDLGVMRLVRECFPDFPIHASTQMTIHNIEGARFAKELGFSRVVLSRELTFGEIKNISENVDIELEVFVHGALCMSYSGQCLMSSFIGGRSGNRGACAQPCRLPYTLLDRNKKPLSQKEKYLLSLKDLCLVDDLETLSECNVKSLKIEGRMKSAEYVSVVTSVYDKYRNGGKVKNEDMSLLENIFSRNGFTKSYLYGSTGRSMLNYCENNDKVYSNISTKVHDTASELIRKPHLPIDISVKAELKIVKPMKLTMEAKGKTVSVMGQVSAEEAVKVPITPERIEAQLTKLGNTPFRAVDVKIDAEENISIPIREINELRRIGTEKLEEELSFSGREPVYTKFSLPEAKTNGKTKPNLNVQIRTMEQFDCAVRNGADKILIPYTLYVNNKKHIDTSKVKTAVVLPSISRDIFPIDTGLLPEEVYVSNISQLSIKDRKINADFALNTYNSSAIKFMADIDVGSVCVSPELNIVSVKKLAKFLPIEVVSYGRIPLMTMQNCVVKSSFDKCGCGDDYYLLKDRKGAFFPLVAEKGPCINTVYNSLPIYMSDRMDELIGCGIEAHRFNFTVETGEEADRIFAKFKNGEKADFDFTRGHYYRGV